MPESPSGEFSFSEERARVCARRVLSTTARPGGWGPPAGLVPLPPQPCSTPPYPRGSTADLCADQSHLAPPRVTGGGGRHPASWSPLRAGRLRGKCWERRGRLWARSPWGQQTAAGCGPAPSNGSGARPLPSDLLGGRLIWVAAAAGFQTGRRLFNSRDEDSSPQRNRDGCFPEKVVCLLTSLCGRQIMD